MPHSRADPDRRQHYPPRPRSQGAVVVNGSHGGVYAAYVAAKLGVAAAIFNDAGIGRDAAGIAGLEYLAQLGVPAAAVGHIPRASATAPT